MPDILLSVRRIERFSVVLGPTGSMSIVAISSPDMRQLRDIESSKIQPDQPNNANHLPPPSPADISSRRLLSLLSAPLWGSFSVKTIFERDRSLRKKDPGAQAHEETQDDDDWLQFAS